LGEDKSDKGKSDKGKLGKAGAGACGIAGSVASSAAGSAGMACRSGRGTSVAKFTLGICGSVGKAAGTCMKIKSGVGDIKPTLSSKGRA